MSRLATKIFNTQVAARLAAVRAASGLTQVHFAASIGLSDRALSNYERAERELPATALRELLTVYGVDPAWMLTGGEEEPRYLVERELNQDVLAEVFDAVGQELRGAKVVFTSAKYARFLYLAYRYSIEDGEISVRKIRDLIRVAC